MCVSSPSVSKAGWETRAGARRLCSSAAVIHTRRWSLDTGPTAFTARGTFTGIAAQGRQQLMETLLHHGAQSPVQRPEPRALRAQDDVFPPGSSFSPFVAREKRPSAALAGLPVPAVRAGRPPARGSMAPPANPGPLAGCFHAAEPCPRRTEGPTLRPLLSAVPWDSRVQTQQLLLPGCRFMYTFLFNLTRKRYLTVSTCLPH